MIPYIKISDIELIKSPEPIGIHPFGILVALGVMIGIWLTTGRAKRLGYDLHQLNSFITWMLLSGFIGAHVLDSLFYHWDEVVAHPITLIMLHKGLSSFGGFTGALIGIVLWKYLEWRPGKGFRVRPAPRSILVFADLVMSCFPVAWIFGRSGCTVVHDHPGASAPLGSPLAVLYPLHEGDGRIVDLIRIPLWNHSDWKISFIYGSDPRFDLGLLEMLFTVILATCVVLTWRRKMMIGTYIIASSLAYAPVRFAMDFLRQPESQGGDTRYAIKLGSFALPGLTPAQWECFALFLFGLAMLIYCSRLKRREGELIATVRAPTSIAPSPL